MGPAPALLVRSCGVGGNRATDRATEENPRGQFQQAICPYGLHAVRVHSNPSPFGPAEGNRGLTQAELLARQLHTALAAAGHTVAVAESLTAGLLGATLADAPGASKTFLGGVIARHRDQGVGAGRGAWVAGLARRRPP
ncbi:CinA family protein [Streptomyces sp. NPDC001530]|uniref:CinA family protein n=1 Tax=Streptomyces sp. NPDC001530 TaxID=3364582 RepID=UPI0036C8A734